MIAKVYLTSKYAYYEGAVLVIDREPGTENVLDTAAAEVRRDRCLAFTKRRAFRVSAEEGVVLSAVRFILEGSGIVGGSADGRQAVLTSVAQLLLADVEADELDKNGVNSFSLMWMEENASKRSSRGNTVASG